MTFQPINKFSRLSGLVDWSDDFLIAVADEVSHLSQSSSGLKFDDYPLISWLKRSLFCLGALALGFLTSAITMLVIFVISVMLLHL